MLLAYKSKTWTKRRRVAIDGNGMSGDTSAGTGPDDATVAQQQIDIDYDELARALVREFPIPDGPGGPAERDEYALRLEMARLRLAALLGDLTDERGSLLTGLPLDD
jgi:hypothetical protein